MYDVFTLIIGQGVSLHLNGRRANIHAEVNPQYKIRLEQYY